MLSESYFSQLWRHIAPSNSEVCPSSVVWMQGVARGWCSHLKVWFKICVPFIFNENQLGANGTCKQRHEMFTSFTFMSLPEVPLPFADTATIKANPTGNGWTSAFAVKTPQHGMWSCSCISPANTVAPHDSSFSCCVLEPHNGGMKSGSVFWKLTGSTSTCTLPPVLESLSKWRAGLRLVGVSELVVSM